LAIASWWEAFPAEIFWLVVRLSNWPSRDTSLLWNWRSLYL
jgi:hypothetical protein